MSIGTGISAPSTAAPGPLAPPADWYADPANPTLLRWWSGAEWTEHTAARPASPRQAPEATHPTLTAPSTPTPPAGADAPLSRRELRERALTPGPDARPLTASFALRDETGFVEIATTRTPVSVFTPLWPTRVHTFAVWLIATMPLGWAVAELASGLLLTDADLLTIRTGVTAAFLVITLLCAFRDSHLLRLGGHSDTASPWWVLLTPLAYLIARAVRVRQETNVRAPAAAWVWLIASLPMVALLSGIRSIDELVPGI